MERPPEPTDLEEEFAEQESPIPITRQELVEIIRSVLSEPGIMRPSSSATAIEDGAPTYNDRR
jgi:hypothetical protein